MMKWAPLMCHLRLIDPTFFVAEGLQDFVQALDSIISMAFHCRSALEAAQAINLLPLCKVEQVLVQGTHVPARFPPGMCSLEFIFEEDEDDLPCSAELPSLLIYHPLPYKGLKALRLDLAMLTQFSLACPYALPQLDLVLDLCLRDSTLMELSWLKPQPCVLKLFISLVSADPCIHQAAIRELQPLAITELGLTLKARIPTHVLSLWSSVAVLGLCRLEVGSSFASVPEAAQAFPRCAHLELSTWFPRPSLYITWAALTDYARSIRFDLSSYCELHVLGAGELPETLHEQPWQLSGRALQVYGLPVACKDDSFIMQSAAAVSVGWTAENRS